MKTAAVPPTSEMVSRSTAPSSSKRAFEKIILDICRLAAQSRKVAGEYMDSLMHQSEKNTQSQTKWHLFGSVAEIVTGVSTAVVATKFMGSNAKTIPTTFQMGTKVGEVFKNTLSYSQYSDQMKKEKIQYATGQWQTWANGLQDLVRNLEGARARLQQMEDAANH